MKKFILSFTKSLRSSLISPDDDSIKCFEPLSRVVPDATRCVQCGVCGYNCPVGIPVRDYAHRGLAVDDPNCITCGNCIQVCPRGTLRWETQLHSMIVNRAVTTPVLVDVAEPA